MKNQIYADIKMFYVTPTKDNAKKLANKYPTSVLEIFWITKFDLYSLVKFWNLLNHTIASRRMEALVAFEKKLKEQGISPNCSCIICKTGRARLREQLS
ncbi:hypothetical protein KC901_02695 [Patescibacteria group bacterium]|nr:hypothetical protein [Patescibacteria group bacterium]